MYDHYIAVDWAQKNMAIARMTSRSNQIKSIDVPSDVRELRLYLTALKGSKIITFEETTSSQWLYTELKAHVNEVLVCDPHRNHLLSSGPKTDILDAERLVQLLKAGLLKSVFHSGDAFIVLRKVVSGYQDVIQAGVRLKNQRASLLRATGKSKSKGIVDSPAEKFVMEGLEKGIESYELERERYEGEFCRFRKKHKMIQNLETIPGIGIINSVKVASVVVDPKRFKSKGCFLSYCGLIKQPRISGGRVYGKSTPRYCRILKSVFKTAALSATIGTAENIFKDYYRYLIKEKNYPEHNARHAVARRIAVVTFGVLKTGKKFEAEKIKCKAL